MDLYGRVSGSASEDDSDLRRGPWTVEEDRTLMNYIANHGEGRWNSLSRCAGLKRTGKSCRLRWLNYLRPDVRRGNITAEEQLLILELHSRWGNRWSKIAQHLPGRTDNEIKNYWRTRVQKHAKQLQCDVNSKQFKDVMRYHWMPRLLERIRATSTTTTTTTYSLDVSSSAAADYQYLPDCPYSIPGDDRSTDQSGSEFVLVETSSSGSLGTQLSPPLPAISDSLTDCYIMQSGGNVETSGGMLAYQFAGWCPELLPSPSGYPIAGSLEFDQGATWGESMCENLWGVDDIWSLQQLSESNTHAWSS